MSFQIEFDFFQNSPYSHRGTCCNRIYHSLFIFYPINNRWKTNKQDPLEVKQKQSRRQATICINTQRIPTTAIR